MTRAVTVWIVILNLSHAPIPWVHQHRGMSRTALVDHVASYHPATPTAQLPTEWHAHLACLGLDFTHQHGDGWQTLPCRCFQTLLDDQRALRAPDLLRSELERICQNAAASRWVCGRLGEIESPGVPPQRPISLLDPTLMERSRCLAATVLIL